ncbi:MAG: GNAT family N-acetyltransferase [Acidobacteria bacterium]|nr:GNAT family N-acetyltransferase [Acidobacteriota bacterium]MCI0655949.1 GNAT family N-acetyltransferase [Acidobacteriota bacterium]
MNEQQIVGRYPKTIALKDGTKVLLREMMRTDREKLYEFFAKIPEEDRKFLKHDVSKKEVIDTWLKDIDYARVFPLLAEVDGKIVADATLHRRSSGWLRHVGEVRLVVDPTYRRKGLGSHLLEELILLAADLGLEKLVAELVAEERAAMLAFQRFNFEQVAVLPGIMRDQGGTNHDLVVMVLNVSTAYLPDWYYF